MTIVTTHDMSCLYYVFLRVLQRYRCSGKSVLLYQDELDLEEDILI